jgi:hypothetical protein
MKKVVTVVGCAFCEDDTTALLGKKDGRTRRDGNSFI